MDINKPCSDSKKIADDLKKYSDLENEFKNYNPVSVISIYCISYYDKSKPDNEEILQNEIKAAVKKIGNKIIQECDRRGTAS